MMLQRIDIAGFLILLLTLCLASLLIGIQLGQSGVARVERGSREYQDVRLRRQMQRIGKIVGAAETDVSAIIESAVANMREAASKPSSGDDGPWPRPTDLRDRS